MVIFVHILLLIYFFDVRVFDKFEIIFFLKCSIHVQCILIDHICDIISLFLVTPQIKLVELCRLFIQFVHVIHLCTCEHRLSSPVSMFLISFKCTSTVVLLKVKFLLI